MRNNAARFPRTDLDAVIAHCDARDAATVIAAGLYDMPRARLDGARPPARHWLPGLGDAWDLVAWLLWRWTPLPTWNAVEVDDARIGDLLEGAMRVKAALCDRTVMAFVAGAEAAMCQSLRRPPYRVELMLPHTAACRVWTEESGRPAFFLPTHTTAGAS